MLPRPQSPRVAMIVVALIGLVLDQASKAWVFASPSSFPGSGDVAPGVVATLLARNNGAVANLAGNRPMTAPICALNGLIVLIAAGWWSYRYIERWRWHDAAFVGILSAGMLGNSIDRLALGYVRDFLVARPWPSLIFNLADVFIVFGFLLLLGSWVGSRLGRTRAARSRGWSSP